jgi:hypothetical protein
LLPLAREALSDGRKTHPAIRAMYDTDVAQLAIKIASNLLPNVGVREHLAQPRSSNAEPQGSIRRRSSGRRTCRSTTVV